MSKVNNLSVDVDSVTVWDGEQTLEWLVDRIVAVRVSDYKRDESWTVVYVERWRASDRVELRTSTTQRQSPQLNSVSCRVSVNLLFTLANEVDTTIVYQKTIHLPQTHQHDRGKLFLTINISVYQFRIQLTTRAEYIG